MSEIVGTVNLGTNPSAEFLDPANPSTCPGWVGTGGATVARDATHAWDGVASARVECPGLGADEGVVVRSVAGLDKTGVEEVSWGQVRLAGDVPGGVAVWVRGRYADGTSQDGARSAAVVLTRTGLTPNDWHAAYAPAFYTDPARRLVSAEIVAAIPTTAGARTFWADGAQIEEDRGRGHTPFAVGSYGAPYHRWAGAEHASVTVREPIPLDGGTSGRGGDVVVSGEVWRATAANERLEDLSAWVESATVTVDTSRDVSRDLSLTIRGEGWRRVEPIADWLAVYQTVVFADGTRRHGQLGLFAVDPQSVDAEEGGDRPVSVTGYSGEWVVAALGFPAKYEVRSGTRKVRSAKDVLETCGLGVRHVDIPVSDSDLRFAASWPKGTSKLAIINELLEGAGYLPLWATARGKLASMPARQRRFRRMEPSKAIAAYVPPNAGVSRGVARVASLPSEVVGAVAVAGRLGPLAENRVVVVSADPRGQRNRIERVIRHPNHPISVSRVGDRPSRPIRRRLVDTDATAEELALAFLEESGSGVESVSLSVLPDPTWDCAHAVVALAIWDALGQPVAVGRYKTSSVTYGFSPSDAAMQMTLGRVHDALVIEEAAA